MAFGMRFDHSLIALTFLCAATACGGRQTTDQTANEHPTASAGSAGVPVSGAGGASSGGSGGGVGQGGSSAITPEHRCSFDDATAPSDTPSGATPSSPEVVQAKIVRLLLDGGSKLPTALPPTNQPGWASATATQILDAATRGDVGIPPFFVKWLTAWDYNIKAPATLKLWVYEITKPDATLSTLIATPKPWSGPHGVGFMTDVDILTGRPGIDRRGMMILQQLLGLLVPPAPPNFMTTPPNLMTGMTERTAHEAAISQPVCAACHKMMDPLGHAFGHFDRNGGYQVLDNGLPVDASDEFTTQGGQSLKFSSIDDLAPQLAQSCEVAKTVAGSLLRLAIDFDGTLNNDHPYDEADRIAVANAFADSGFSIRTVVRSVVESPSFQR
jgi:hypothetical protein